MREQFEAWAEKERLSLAYADCGYAYSSTAMAWAAWQAATASMQAERDQLAAENVHLREQIMCWARECDRITYRHTNKITDSHQKECEGDLKNIETPATGRFLAEQRAQGRVEGINFAAARVAAAFNHGFIDKPTSEVYDVVKAVLGAKEEIATAPEDGLSGVYADRALNDWAAQLRNEVNV